MWFMPLTDGGGHPAAIVELETISKRSESGFPRACGALIQKRHQILKQKKLDADFQCHLLKDGGKLYEINHPWGGVGITSIFTIQDDKLILLAIVPFDNIIEEAMSAEALLRALQLAQERMKTLEINHET